MNKYQGFEETGRIKVKELNKKNLEKLFNY